MSITKNWDYSPIEYKNQDIEINDYPFYAENISASEPFSRRDYIETPIMNGTIQNTKGAFIPREFTFKTVMYITPEKPEVHDTILRKMVTEPATIYCRDMGEPFKAKITIKKERSKPRSLELDFTIKEIPENSSDITQSIIYEGTTTSITVEAYDAKNKKIVEAQESKGKVLKTKITNDKNKNTETSK
jgi:hypothetical protein